MLHAYLSPTVSGWCGSAGPRPGRWVVWLALGLAALGCFVAVVAATVGGYRAGPRDRPAAPRGPCAGGRRRRRAAGHVGRDRAVASGTPRLGRVRGAVRAAGVPEFGGFGLRFRADERAFVTRSGEALRVVQRDGTRTYVSVDGAGGGGGGAQRAGHPRRGRLTASGSLLGMPVGPQGGEVPQPGLGQIGAGQGHRDPRQRHVVGVDEVEGFEPRRELRLEGVQRPEPVERFEPRGDAVAPSVRGRPSGLRRRRRPGGGERGRRQRGPGAPLVAEPQQ